MVDLRHESSPAKKKRSRRKAGERLPRLGLKPLDPEKRLLTPRQRIPANQWAPEINSDLTPDFPITNAEIDAILLLLGDDLKTILG